MSATLQDLLATGAPIATIAAEAGVTGRRVIEALPEATRHFGEGAFLADALSAIGRWGEVRVVIQTGAGPVEVTGPLPKDRITEGFSTLSPVSGLYGYLRGARCGGIAFVERSVSGVPTASAVFLGPDDGILFEVFIGRHGTGALRHEQLAAFRALREAVVAEHIPD